MQVQIVRNATFPHVCNGLGGGLGLLVGMLLRLKQPVWRMANVVLRMVLLLEIGIHQHHQLQQLGFYIEKSHM